MVRKCDISIHLPTTPACGEGETSAMGMEAHILSVAPWFRGYCGLGLKNTVEVCILKILCTDLSEVP